MQKSYKSHSICSEIKFALKDCFRQNKIKFIVCSLVLLASLIVGIVIAIKFCDRSSLYLSNYGLVDFSGGAVSSSFFSRFFSMLLLMLLLFACSFTPFTFPLAILILAYRTYLLGLNLTLLFVLYGVPGILISAIIALPIQLAIIAVLLVFYICLYSCSCKNSFAEKGSKVKIALSVGILLFVINLLETILLAIFAAKVILVI